MDVSLTLWVLTIVGLAALIAVDFFIGRKPHDVSIKEAGIWTVVWIALAGLFGLGLLLFGGGQPAGEFFAGFITEKSLSVDNLFVFVLIMAKFAVPSQYQQRVLLVGVLIALVLRAIFIAAGAAIIASFAWVFYIFGAFLIWTAWKLIQEARADDEDEEFEENKLLKAVERRFGVADRYHGTKLWIAENGKRVMTPMLVVMLAIGTTDVLFALDSIPAIFGLTQDPYIVFTANAFALMGLQAAVLPHRRPAQEARPPQLRPVGHPRLHRREAGAARAARVRRPRPGDLHPGLARRDLRRPRVTTVTSLSAPPRSRRRRGRRRRRTALRRTGRGLAKSDAGTTIPGRHAVNRRPTAPGVRLAGVGRAVHDRPDRHHRHRRRVSGSSAEHAGLSRAIPACIRPAPGTRPPCSARRGRHVAACGAAGPHRGCSPPRRPCSAPAARTAPATRRSLAGHRAERAHRPDHAEEHQQRRTGAGARPSGTSTPRRSRIRSGTEAFSRRSPCIVTTGVSEPFTSTAAMMQVSMTVRLTPTRSFRSRGDHL